jgi:hypothetical protein
VSFHDTRHLHYYTLGLVYVHGNGSISITKASSFDVYTNLWIVEFLYYVENPQESWPSIVDGVKRVDRGLVNEKGGAIRTFRCFRVSTVASRRIRLCDVLLWKEPKCVHQTMVPIVTEHQHVARRNYHRSKLIFCSSAMKSSSSCPSPLI